MIMMIMLIYFGCCKLVYFQISLHIPIVTESFRSWPGSEMLTFQVKLSSQQLQLLWELQQELLPGYKLTS